MSDRLTALILICIALLFIANVAFAGSVTFANMCAGARYVQKGPDLQIWCGSQLWLTYKGCARARVRVCACVRMRGCARAGVRACTGACLLRCAGVHVHACAGARVHGTARARVRACEGVRVRRCA